MCCLNQGWLKMLYEEDRDDLVLLEHVRLAKLAKARERSLTKNKMVLNRLS